MDFVKVDPRGANATYIKATESSLQIISPGKGAVELDAAAAKQLLDFRRSFAYSRRLIARQKRGASITPDVLEYNVQNSQDGGDELEIVTYTLSRTNDTPDVKITRVDIASGEKIGYLDLSWDVFDVVVRELDKAGISTDIMALTDVVEVNKLPNETSARRDVVYRYKGEYYKLNAEEDALDKIEGPFKTVRKLPEFTTQAVEDTLYNLGYGYYDEDAQQRFEKGVYTYDAESNKGILEDLNIVRVGRLPKATKAKENQIYVLTADDNQNEKAEGTAWKLNDTKDEFEEETRPIINCSTLPFKPLAETDTYYIVSNTMKKAAEDHYDTVGPIITVDLVGLPDVEKIKLNGSTVYILKQDEVRADGSVAKMGTTWIFNVNTKAFEEYKEDDPPKIGFDVIEASEEDTVPSEQPPAAETGPVGGQQQTEQEEQKTEKPPAELGGDQDTDGGF